MMDKIIDLHCDLTCFLIEPGITVNSKMRSSVENLRKGNVGFQVMAFYSSTGKGSVQYVEKQIVKYKDLLELPDFFEFNAEITELKENGIGIIGAVENASGLCEEDAPVETAFERLSQIKSKLNLMYITFAHHLENRFGGGNYTDVGLKKDGKLLLEHLHNHKIAVDLSHTSDRLAVDMLNFIDQNNLKIPVIASHSNMRSVFSHPRNLPDELVQEIVKRKGLIGLNFVKYFINPEKADDFYSHLEYALKLGAENHIAFGADFFADELHPETEKFPFFFDELCDATVYPSVAEKVKNRFGEEVSCKFSSRNVLNYFENLNLNY